MQPYPYAHRRLEPYVANPYAQPRAPQQPAPPHSRNPYHQPPRTQPPGVQPYAQPYPQPYAPPYPQAYPYVYYRTRDVFATAGFVLSLIGGIVLAPVFCILALTRVRTSGEKGRNLAVAGLVISGVWLLAGLLFAVVAALAPAGRDDSGQIVDGGTLNVHELRTGDCLAGLPESGTTSVDAVPCAGPHQVEVFYSFPLPDLPWPGEDAVIETARGECDGKVPDRLSGLDVMFLYPQRDAWEQGDREITCLASSEPAAGSQVTV